MRLLAFVISLSLLFSCSEEKKTLTGYSGNVGEVIVVCSDDTWEGPVGHSMREYFSDIVYGLPQDELSFDLIHFRKEKFKSIIESHRNIVYITISSEIKGTSFKLQKSKYSRGQLFLDLRSNHQDSLAEFLKINGADLSQKFKDIEINRLYLKNKKFGSKDLRKEIKENLQFDFVPQKDLYLEKLDSNKAWLRLERERTKGGYKHQISQGVLLFTKDYTAREDFAESRIIAWCDTVLKNTIPGPSEGSYMQIGVEHVFPLSREINFAGNYAREMRGLWYMENNFMGGGFFLLATLDEKNDRVIAAYGYVYAPGFDKREYIREIEAMVKSVKLL